MDKEFLKWLDNEAVCAREDRQTAEREDKDGDSISFHKGRERALYDIVGHLKDILWKEAME